MFIEGFKFPQILMDVEGAGNEAGGGDSNQGGAPQFEEGFQWIGELPEHYHDDATLKKFSQNDEAPLVQLPETFLKSYKDLEGRVEKGGDLDLEDDTQRKEVFEKLGWKENSEDYMKSFDPIEIPEGIEYDKSEEEFLLQLAHENNMPVSQAQAMRKQIVETRVKSIQDAEQANRDYVEKVEADLIKEFGTDLGVVKKRGYAAVEDMGDDNFKFLLDNAELDGIKVGDHPFAMKFMAKLGKEKLGLGNERGSGKEDVVQTKDDIQSEIAKIQTHKAFMDNSHPEHKQIVNRYTTLFRKLHGEI